ncbi:MAG: hypothetical protein ACXVC6_06190 [Bacteroidia bacterium]
MTPSWGGKRKLPFVFTEQGVAMLSGVLHSYTAIMVNIQIMKFFTRLRQILIDNTELRLVAKRSVRKQRTIVKTLNSCLNTSMN